MRGNNKLLHVCGSYMCPTFDDVESGYCRNIFLNQNELFTDLTVNMSSSREKNYPFPFHFALYLQLFTGCQATNSSMDFQRTLTSLRLDFQLQYEIVCLSLYRGPERRANSSASRAPCQNLKSTLPWHVWLRKLR